MKNVEHETLITWVTPLIHVHVYQYNYTLSKVKYIEIVFFFRHIIVYFHYCVIYGYVNAYLQTL